MNAVSPLHDAERQRTLDLLEVLDRPPLPAFGHVVQVASTLARTPIALVSLVDRDRLFFMARAGLDVTEVPNEGSLCNCALATPDRMLEVEDASKDPRFATSPLITDFPGIRFYAAVPLVIARHPIGTLCVIDRQPRQLTESQRVALDALAQVTMELFEYRRRELSAWQRQAS